MLIQSTYSTKFPVNNGHLETIIPYFLRQVPKVPFGRERINTKDGDFLDLDWHRANNSKLVVLSHGLEGCSESNYIMGLTRHLSSFGYDVLAWNNRGCSGETNNLLKMYHSGASYDLREVLNHVFHNTNYQEINLVGFSMGGNITLKYLGEEANNLNSRIKKAVAVSVPISLADCAEALSKGFSKVYARTFIRRIIKKLHIKTERFPDYDPDFKTLNKIWDFEEFDDRITAPINGFENAQDYWDQSSSMHYLKDIQLKTLIVNALNDPFLKKRCYPFEELKNHAYIDFETPLRGGHVGFVQTGLNDVWIDKRITEYLAN